MKTLAIVLEGGLIQAVVSDEVMDDIQILVIDYDINGADEEDIFEVPQNNRPEMPTALATGFVSTVSAAGIDLQAAIKNMKEKEMNSVSVN